MLYAWEFNNFFDSLTKIFTCDWVYSNAGVEAEIEPLTLANIRESLIRQEDTIIYALLQRAQFSFNGPTYDRNSFAIPGFEGSLVEFMLKETERLHAKVSSSDVRNFCRVFNCSSFAPMYKMPSNSRKSMFIEKRYVRSYFFMIMPWLGRSGGIKLPMNILFSLRTYRSLFCPAFPSLR